MSTMGAQWINYTICNSYTKHDLCIITPDLSPQYETSSQASPSQTPQSQSPQFQLPLSPASQLQSSHPLTVHYQSFNSQIPQSHASLSQTLNSLASQAPLTPQSPSSLSQPSESQSSPLHGPQPQSQALQNQASQSQQLQYISQEQCQDHVRMGKLIKII